MMLLQSLASILLLVPISAPDQTAETQRRVVVQALEDEPLDATLWTKEQDAINGWMTEHGYEVIVLEESGATCYISNSVLPLASMRQGTKLWQDISRSSTTAFALGNRESKGIEDIFRRYLGETLPGSSEKPCLSVGLFLSIGSSDGKMNDVRQTLRQQGTDIEPIETTPKKLEDAVADSKKPTIFVPRILAPRVTTDLTGFENDFALATKVQKEMWVELDRRKVEVETAYKSAYNLGMSWAIQLIAPELAGLSDGGMNWNGLSGETKKRLEYALKNSPEMFGFRSPEDASNWLATNPKLQFKMDLGVFLLKSKSGTVNGSGYRIVSPS